MPQGRRSFEEEIKTIITEELEGKDQEAALALINRCFKKRKEKISNEKPKTEKAAAETKDSYY